MYGKGDEIRFYSEEPSPLGVESYRSPYRRDYARIIHSHSFRRLQGKQQLYPGLESDFFRSRLTHSLEVAQIAKSIGISINAQDPQLKAAGVEISLDLLEIAGVAHDIGHPPFGHKGESALDKLMKPYGGFEGNAQTIRVLTALEKKFKDGNRVGLNLTARSIAAVLKYDAEIKIDRSEDDKLAKGYYHFDRDLINNVKTSVLGTTYTGTFETIECSIMNLADDIAYSVFDFEDGLKAGFYTLFDFIYSHDLTNPNNIFEKVAQKLIDRKIETATASGVYKTIEKVIYYLLGIPELPKEVIDLGEEAVQRATNAYYYSMNLAYGNDGYLRTQASSHLIGKFIRGIEFEYNSKIPQLSTVSLKPEILLEVETLKQFVYVYMVNSPRILISETRGFDIVTEVFKSISEKPRLLPQENYNFYCSAKDDVSRMRIICDFVSGMTDRYAIEFYGRLKSMDPVTIFKQY